MHASTGARKKPTFGLMEVKNKSGRARKKGMMKEGESREEEDLEKLEESESV